MFPPEEERVEFIFAHLIYGNGPYRTATLNVMPILPLAAAFFRDNDYCHREVYYFVQDLFFCNRADGQDLSRGLTCKLLVTCTCKDVNAYNANDVFICFQPWPAAQTRWREVAGHRTWSRGVTAPTARSVAAALVFSLSERTLQRPLLT